MFGQFFLGYRRNKAGVHPDGGDPLGRVNTNIGSHALSVRVGAFSKPLENTIYNLKMKPCESPSISLWD